MKKSTSVFFWVRHLGLALALVVIAAVVVVIQGRFASAPRPEGAEPSKSLSKGMSDFYTSYKLSSTKPFEDNVGDFVVELNPSDEPLDERLQDMESLKKPVSRRWVGVHKYRTFKAGNTLRQAISRYAEQEGMQVIWELDQDFVVKHQFQMEDTIVGSLKKIASAIDTNFDGKVRAFVCPKQRSLVITNDKRSGYLKENCTEATG